MANGEAFKVLKKFAIQSMKDFGVVGKKSVEEKIQIEAMALTKEIEKYNEQPHCPGMCTQMAVTNIICSIIFGDRYMYMHMHYRYLIKPLSCDYYVADTSMMTSTSMSFWIP